MNIHENAIRAKLRFTTPRGLISTEDLWDLALTSKTAINLDDIAKGIAKELRESEDSFVVTTPTNTTLELKFDIVRHVISIKLEEAEEAKDAKINAERKSKILHKINELEEEELTEGKSIKQLRKEAAKL